MNINNYKYIPKYVKIETTNLITDYTIEILENIQQS
jgi:hypothetical protein